MTIGSECCPSVSFESMRKEVAAAIAQSGVIQLGEKLARGGLNLPGMWVNLSLLPSAPHALRTTLCGLDRLFSRRFLGGVVRHEYAFVAVMTGGATFAAYLGERYGRPFGFAHKDGRLELHDHVLASCRIIFVEDVVTEAGSLTRAGEVVKTRGGAIAGALAIAEYGLASANENLRHAGIDCHAVTTVGLIASAAHERGVLSDEQVLRVARWIENPY